MPEIEQATAAPGEKRDVRRRVRIVSNGMGGPGTKVLDANGEMIPGVTSVSWVCGVGEVAEATLTIRNVEVEVEAEIIGG